MIKKLLVAGFIGLAVLLTGCVGDRVEIPPAHVAKVSGKNGYEEGIKTTSKFVMNRWCLTNCDKLVLLDVSDRRYTIQTNILLPEDKLPIGVIVDLTLAVDPNQYEFIFAKQRAGATQGITSAISLEGVFNTYADNIATTRTREIISKYSVGEISSNQQGLNAILSQELGELVNSKTPFITKYIGIRDIKYPEVIIKAQESAAKRREEIEQERANLEVSKVALQRELQEAQLQRKIDVEKAEAEAEVNKILGESLTDKYLSYKSLEVATQMANSTNKVFMPVEMLSTIGGQIQLQGSK